MSEVVRNPSGEEMNDHHGVPRSFLGTADRNTNITLIPISEHAAFHQMAGHKPPASFLRRMLLTSVNWHDDQGRMLPAGMYADMLPLLTPEDWRTLYQPGAIKQESELVNGNCRTKAAVHIHLHLWEEQALVSQAIGALGISRYLARDTRDFMVNAMLFFHKDTPTEAAYAYLTDKNHLDDRKWTKPLRPDLHSDLCDLTKAVRLERMTLENRKKLLRTLGDHHQYLQHRSRSWSPTLDESMDAIAVYGDARMEDMLAKRRH